MRLQGGGAAGSEVREASERAGASEASGETTGGGDGSDDGRPARRPRGGKKSRQSWIVRRANAAKGRQGSLEEVAGETPVASQARHASPLHPADGDVGC